VLFSRTKFEKLIMNNWKFRLFGTDGHETVGNLDQHNNTHANQRRFYLERSGRQCADPSSNERKIS